MSVSISNQRQYNWRQMGSLTTAQSALTTSKSAATVNALTSTGIVKLTVPDGAISMELRFRVGGSDGDSNVLVLYAMRDNDDHYTPIITLTTTNGTQSDGTYTFVDTITGTNEIWDDDIVLKSGANNGIASVRLNTHGYSNFLIIATTLNSTSLIVDYARV